MRHHPMSRTSYHLASERVASCAGAAQLCGGISAAAGDVQRGAPPAGQLPASSRRHHQGAVHLQAPARWHGGAPRSSMAATPGCHFAVLRNHFSSCSDSEAIRHSILQGVLAVAEACGMQNLLKAAGVEYQARRSHLSVCNFECTVREECVTWLSDPAVRPVRCIAIRRTSADCSG